VQKKKIEDLKPGDKVLHPGDNMIVTVESVKPRTPRARKYLTVLFVEDDPFYGIGEPKQREWSNALGFEFVTDTAHLEMVRDAIDVERKSAERIKPIIDGIVAENPWARDAVQHAMVKMAIEYTLDHATVFLGTMYAAGYYFTVIEATQQKAEEALVAEYSRFVLNGAAWWPCEPAELLEHFGAYVREMTVGKIEAL
jgi:hypothetical protein